MPECRIDTVSYVDCQLFVNKVLLELCVHCPHHKYRTVDGYVICNAKPPNKKKKGLEL